MSRTVSLLLALSFACAGTQQEVAPPTEAAPAGEMAPETVLATYEGGQVTWGDLQGELDGQLRAMEVEFLMKKYDTMSQALDQKVNEALLIAEAKKRGLTGGVDELLVLEIDDKVPPPSQADITMFYSSVQRQLGGATLEEATPMLAQELVRRAQIERFQTYMGELRAAAHVQATLPYPDLPRIDVAVAADDPFEGPADAPITIVQFAEYQCPYCKAVSPTLDQLRANYDGKIKVVFKDYPLPAHSRAMPAAIAAHCAGDQGKYWDMNHVLLSSQPALGDDDIAGYAKGLDLDMPTFTACLGSGKHDATIAADMAEGEKAGVQATPTLFVNGILVAGALPYEQFAKLVDQELAHN